MHVYANGDVASDTDFSAMAVIQDNDHDGNLPVILIDPIAKGAEGTSSTNIIDFRVSLSKPSPVGVSVDYTTVDGTAMSTEDYVSKEGTLTIPAGNTSGVISIQLRNSDRMAEPQESFSVVLTNPVNAIFGGGVDAISSEGIIIDDDTAAGAPAILPLLRVRSEPVLEGDAGTTSLAFRVGVYTIDGLLVPTPTAIPFQYEILSGTAMEGSDFAGGAGEAAVAAGSSESVITVDVVGDPLVEPDESLFIRLSSPVGAEFGPGVMELFGTAWIMNDDDEAMPPAPVLSLLIVRLGNAQAELRWPSQSLFTYELEASSDLSSWGSEATFPGEDEEVRYGISLDQGPRYFRLRTIDSE